MPEPEKRTTQSSQEAVKLPDLEIPENKVISSVEAKESIMEAPPKGSEMADIKILKETIEEIDIKKKPEEIELQQLEDEFSRLERQRRMYEGLAKKYQEEYANLSWFQKQFSDGWSGAGLWDKVRHAKREVEKIQPQLQDLLDKIDFYKRNFIDQSDK